jgi:hypothetical protein
MLRGFLCEGLGWCGGDGNGEGAGACGACGAFCGGGSAATETREEGCHCGAIEQVVED